MSIPVALCELADAMAEYRFAYLMTVGDDERVHAVAVTPRLDGERLVIDNPGRRSRANTAVRGGVSMVWP
ncbi:MAG: hypothetical protein ACRDQA_12550, partial [Nocardioidaceae bacterium]